METLKTLYEKINSDDNKNLKRGILFSIFLCIVLIALAIKVFKNLITQQDKFSRPIPVYYQKSRFRKPINKSPDKNKYLIRKKSGYVEQSPEKKKYPTKYRISSLLT